MDYRPFPPPPDLAPWVECAWLLRGVPSQLILPDGRLELIFHFGETHQPKSLIAGRMLQGLHLKPAKMNALGIRLRPEASATLFPCHELPGIESLESVLGPWATTTREQLGNNLNFDQVWDHLRTLKRSSPDAAIAHSIRRMEAARGIGPVDSFLPPGLASRQWQRRFHRATGFTPKSFTRILRFQNVIALAGRKPWADVALETGFYDQSHLTNEFQSFTHQSPEAFLKGSGAMQEFYLDGFFQDPAEQPRV
ncbi:MAG: helix-turn-helix domain-containing protein [Bryobacteraceae bacterium]